MYDNYIMITEQDAEVILEILQDYPQSIKWTVKGVSLENLKNRLTKQIAEKTSISKVEFYVKPTTSTS